MKILITILIVALFLIVNEIWWQSKKNRGELSRKLTHIIVGTFAAFWPFYLSWNDIRLISVAFLIVVLISQKLKIFGSIHNVNRHTWGEAMFAVAVGLTTFIT